MVAVDGGNLWVKIQVCKTVKSCNTPVAGGGTTATVNNTSVTVTNFTYDAHSATVNYCIAISSLSDWKSLRAYGSWPTAPKLLIDQKQRHFWRVEVIIPVGMAAHICNIKLALRRLIKPNKLRL